MDTATIQLFKKHTNQAGPYVCTLDFIIRNQINLEAVANFGPETILLNFSNRLATQLDAQRSTFLRVLFSTLIYLLNGLA